MRWSCRTSRRSLSGSSREFSTQRGHDCVAIERDELTTNMRLRRVSAAEIGRRARRRRDRPAKGGAADAVVIHCTNFRGAPVVGELEQELGIPVIDSVVVGLWRRLCQLDLPLPKPASARWPGFGRLSRPPALAAAR